MPRSEGELEPVVLDAHRYTFNGLRLGRLAREPTLEGGEIQAEEPGRERSMPSPRSGW